ncbi:MAG TPA: hypothetical protein PLF86_03350, partial [Candidatus Moranbacteria bacterium]|nr:hypothetical protein [Candidatus Moranbacteria bacterium]
KTMKTKLIQIFKKSSYWLSVVTLGIILGLSIQFAKAWTEPTAIAPNGNVGAPINTGDNSQYKAGAFGIGKVLRGYSNAIFDGNVGIGTTSPGAKLDVQNSVLVQYSSPVYGVAIRSSNGGGWSRAYHFMKRDDNSILGGFGGYGGANSLTYLWAGPNYSSPYMVWESGTGNVGIGTRTPSQKLDVIGNARVTGGLIIGDTTTCTNGTIRFNSGAFQGCEDGAWVYLNTCKDTCGKYTTSAWASPYKRGATTICEYSGHYFSCKSSESYTMSRYWNGGNYWDVQCNAGSNCWVRNHPSGSWHNAGIVTHCTRCTGEY